MQFREWIVGIGVGGTDSELCPDNGLWFSILYA